MAHLTLVGLSRDKTRLLLVDDAGAEFTLDIDAPLRAAVRGDSARIGQLEIHMESALRPRDIQARIRAGETPETVAEAARTTVERIMVFAAPVLAERAHMADRAQRASVRRRSGEPGARTLGMAVTEQLGAENVAADAVVWDAWRREDGRWTLTGDFASPGRSGGARFSFDPPGNYVVAENDDARWLVGELPPAASRADQTPGVPGRRLAAVSEGDRPLPGTELGDDALELVAEAEEPAGPPPAPVARAAEQEPIVDGASAVDAPEPEPAHEPPHRREVKKSRGRASVPSWDEIMFGGGKQD